MKLVKGILFCMLACCLCAPVSAKKKADKQVYVMGVSINFSDTIVYITDIQHISGVKLTSQGFLPSRDEYSYQLRNYLESMDGGRTHTCITFFDTDIEKLRKKATTLTRKYLNHKSVLLRTLSKEDFSYVKPEEEEE